MDMNIVGAVGMGAGWAIAAAIAAFSHKSGQQASSLLYQSVPQDVAKSVLDLATALTHKLTPADLSQLAADGGQVVQDVRTALTPAPVVPPAPPAVPAPPSA